MQEWNREIVMIDPSALIPHPRRAEAGDRFDNSEALESLPPNLVSLQANILQNGIRDPLLVQNGTNVLLTGHFRRAVALQAEWTAVPAQYLDVNDEEAYWIMLNDNWQRNESIMDDLMAVARNMYHFALRLQMDSDLERNGLNEHQSGSLRDTFSVKFSSEVSKEVRRKFDITRSTIKKYFQLLKLIPELQSWVSAKRLGLEGGALLANMEESAQQDFARVYSNVVKVTDLEIKSFKDMWKDLAQERAYAVQHREKVEASDAVEQTTNVGEGYVGISAEEHPEDAKDEGTGEDVDDDEDDDDQGWQTVPFGQGINAIGTVEVNRLDLPMLSVVDEPRHRTILMRNKLTRLVKRQKGIIQRMNSELRDLITGLKEDSEAHGLDEVMVDMEGLETDLQAVIELIHTAKSHHQQFREQSV